METVTINITRASVLADMKVTLLGINTKKRTDSDIIIQLTVGCKNIDHYNSILSRLRAIPHVQSIERGIAARALRALEAGMATYMGPVFEDICRQWLWRQYAGGRLDFAFDAVGRWWGGDAAEKREAELDIVCLEGKRAVALGECKWRDTAFPASDLERLVERGRLVRAAATAPVYAFAKSGFTEACREMSARNPAIRLVDFAQMARGT